MNEYQKDHQVVQDQQHQPANVQERPWVDQQGRSIVRDANGKIIPYGSGKCVTCGRDAVDGGAPVDDKGRPLAKNAQGKYVGTDRHGNTFDDKGNVTSNRKASGPLVVDANGNPVLEPKP